MSSGPIPWPIGKQGRTKAIALYGALAEAVRRESALAVAHWFGVTAQTVTVSRAALGIRATNEGTSRLRHDYAMEPAIAAGLEKANAKAQDPGRREKIAKAKRGQPRPPHVIEAMREGRTGKTHTEEARRKMSEANRRRGARPPKAGSPWTAEEDELLRTLPSADVAAQTGRTMVGQAASARVAGWAAEMNSRKIGSR